MIVVESILMGILATFFMGVLAGYLVKRNLIYSFVFLKILDDGFFTYLGANLYMKTLTKHLH
jgi:hypothetical protein